MTIKEFPFNLPPDARIDSDGDFVITRDHPDEDMNQAIDFYCEFAVIEQATDDEWRALQDYRRHVRAEGSTH